MIASAIIAEALASALEDVGQDTGDAKDYLRERATEVAQRIAAANRADVEVVRKVLTSQWVGPPGAAKAMNDAEKQRALAALSRLAGET